MSIRRLTDWMATQSYDDWKDCFYGPEGFRTGRTIRQQEQDREREVDAAVREGLRRTLDKGFAPWIMESDYAVREYVRPHVLVAWREQHA